MKKLFQVLSVSLVALLTLSQAEAGRGGGNASPDGRPKYRVVVKLNASNEKGTVQIYQQNAALPTTYDLIKTCNASGGNYKPGTVGLGGVGDWIHNTRPEKDKAIKSPRTSGTWVLDTSANLWYKGAWSSYNNAVYYAEKGGNPIALHSGNLNQNSHGCIRNDCPAFIKAKADETAVACNGNSQVLPPAAGKPCRKFNMLIEVQ